MSTLGEKIRDLRIKKGISQEDMAKDIDRSAKAISAWENDTKTPRMGTVENIAKYFNVPKRYLVDDDVTIDQLPAILATGKIGFLSAGPIGEAILQLLSSVSNLSDILEKHAAPEERAQIGFSIIKDNDERILLAKYRKLSSADKKVVMSLINSLSQKTTSIIE